MSVSTNGSSDGDDSESSDGDGNGTMQLGYFTIVFVLYMHL